MVTRIHQITAPQRCRLIAEAVSDVFTRAMTELEEAPDAQENVITQRDLTARIGYLFPGQHVPEFSVTLDQKSDYPSIGCEASSLYLWLCGIERERLGFIVAEIMAGTFNPLSNLGLDFMLAAQGLEPKRDLNLATQLQRAVLEPARKGLIPPHMAGPG